MSIWCDKKNAWVSKEDTGTESNTEKQKGLASDSFKRACFNWGIGRELYTSPFIFVNADKFTIKEINGKLSTYDKFEVTKIEYNGNNISLLTISKINGGKVFEYNQDKSKKTESPKPEPKQTTPEPKLEPKSEPPQVITPNQAADLVSLCSQKGYSLTKIMKLCQVTELKDITTDLFAKAVKSLEALADVEQ